MLYLVIGPPAAGKTTWVRQHAKPGDITIDYDAIAATIAVPGANPYDQPAHVRKVTKAARQAAIDCALTIADSVDVYLIHSTPSSALLAKYQASGAEIVTIDPGYDVVMERVKAQRPWQMRGAVKDWYTTGFSKHGGKSSKYRVLASKHAGRKAGALSFFGGSDKTAGQRPGAPLPWNGGDSSRTQGPGVVA